MTERNYRKEYDNYQGTDKQKKDRAGRNKARRQAVSKGRVHKGDGKDINHINRNPRDNSPGNTNVESRSTNRARNSIKKG